MVVPDKSGWLVREKSALAMQDGIQNVLALKSYQKLEILLNRLQKNSLTLRLFLAI